MAGRLVVLRKAFSNLRGGDTNNGILAGIVIRLPTKYLDAQGPFLNSFGIVIESMFDCIAKEITIAFAAAKEQTGEDPFQLLANGDFLIGR